MCSNKTVSKTYSGLPDHTRVRVTVIVDFLDRWKGEAIIVKLNGESVQ
jgi:hypothetical protein